MLSDKEKAEIEAARLKNNKVQPGLLMTREDLRFATNNKVAKYRAQRLACGTLLEIGCSIGAQTIEFAKTCKKVIAVDVNERKIKYAKANLENFGIKNVDLICGDGLKLDIKKADIIFCDPEREPAASKRSLSAFKPDIHELVKTYSCLTKNFCVEIPPHTQDINLDCEKEYVSVDGELNRLNLYLGELKTSEASAVVLPDLARIEGKPRIPHLSSTEARTYLYEIDEAVAKAGLIDALAEMLDSDATLFKDDYRFMTSEEMIASPFFRNSFRVVAKTKSQKDAIEELHKNGFGKVILREKINPSDYWKKRREYEENLTGNKTAYLIATNTSHIICERISPAPKRS